VSDKNKSESAAARAGRWFARLLGRRNVDRLADSARALKQEYEKGRSEAEGEPPRTVPHRVVDDDPA